MQKAGNATISAIYPMLPILPLSRFPFPIYCKFFYMQTKPLSNNMPTRRVLIEIPHSNNRPIQSTILLQQPHCKRNKVCKIYRHGWRTPRVFSPRISDHGINYYYILRNTGSRHQHYHFIYNAHQTTSYRGTAGIA